LSRTTKTPTSPTSTATCGAGPSRRSSSSSCGASRSTASWRPSGRPVVQDRTLFEDAEIFAAYQRSLGHIDDRDWATYQELYTTLRSELRAPDLMIYCRCEVKTLRKRIQQRGRQYEQSIPTAYLKALHGLYEAWFDRYDHSPTLVIETDRVDYGTELFDRQRVREAVAAHLDAAPEAAPRIIRP
jgi:deoxyadenosine/deoxycytidine kinase